MRRSEEPTPPTWATYRRRHILGAVAVPILGALDVLTTLLAGGSTYLLIMGCALILVGSYNAYTALYRFPRWFVPPKGLDRADHKGIALRGGPATERATRAVDRSQAHPQETPGADLGFVG